MSRTLLRGVNEIMPIIPHFLIDVAHVRNPGSVLNAFGLVMSTINIRAVSVTLLLALSEFLPIMSPIFTRFR